MAEIRFGVIGCGFVSDFYMRTARNYKNVTIVRAYDRAPANAARFTNYWKVPSTADESAFYDGLQVDAILNLTNPSSHFDVSRRALERGFPVYSEKPIAMSVDEILKLRDLALEKNLPLASAPCNHLSEAFAGFKGALEQGHVGKPLLAYAEMDDGLVARSPYRSWINPSGAPWPYEDEFAVGCTMEHAGYYLTWLVGLFGTVSEVTAFGSLRYPGKPVTPGETEGPDFTVACLQFESGLVARLTCGIIAPHDRQLRIFGEEGVMRLDDCWEYTSPATYNRWLTIRRKFLLNPLSSKIRIAPRADKGSDRMDFIRGPIDVVTAHREGRASGLTLSFCAHVNEVALAIHTARERKEVYKMRTRFDDFAPLAIRKTEDDSLLVKHIIPLAEKALNVIRK
jgi:predicted dehydrogenase